MKKLVLFITVLSLPLMGQAQNAWDALRYSKVNYEGTARSLALGNAMTAVGGDFGSLSINPAGSALYPYAEVTLTPTLSSSFSDVNYAGQGTQDRFTRVGFSNIGYVGSVATGRGSGLVQFTFGVGYNKIQDFTSRTSVRYNNATTSWLSPVAVSTNGFTSGDLESTDGYNPYFDSNASWRSILAWNAYLLDLLPNTTDQYIASTENLYGSEIQVGGPLDQRFIKESTGSMGEYLLNAGFNFGDLVYAGLNLTFQNIYYKTYEKFMETAQDPGHFQSKFDSFTHTYNQVTSGMGFNLKFGMIIRATQNLRIGASVTTPTWTGLEDEWSEYMDAYFINGSESATSPVGTYAYKVTTPFRFNVGLTYTFGQYGLFSIDYEGVDYRSMRMRAVNDGWAYDAENDAIKNGSSNYQFQYANNIRAGVEIRLSPIALRAGYQFGGKPEASYSHSHNISAGLGFRSNSFFADLGAAYRLKEYETFNLYDTEEGLYGTNETSRLKVLLTIGFRF